LTDPSRPGDLRLAVCLTALAGAVDAIGFLKLGGLFVSFMSGNSTEAAAALILHDDARLKIALVLVALFVGGAFAGGIVAWAAGDRRRPVLLALVAALLGAAMLGGREAWVGFAVGVAAFAMGLQNAVLQRAGEVIVGPTYVTGTLVRLGDGLARAVTGRGGVDDWAPYLLLWLGLVAGGAAGALLYARLGFIAVGAPALFAALLAWSEHRRPSRGEPS